MSKYIVKRLFHGYQRLAIERIPNNIIFSRKTIQSSAVTSGANRYFSTIDNNEENNRSSGLLRILNDNQRQIWSDVLSLRKRAKEISMEVKLSRPNSDDSSSSTVVMDEKNEFEKVIPEFESTFTIVVAGEFNAGKSTFINALLGQDILETGSLPTTDAITIVTSSDVEKSSGSSSSSASKHLGIDIIKPSSVIPPLLHDITLIDTPGTNSQTYNHTERTLRLLPSADLIFFLTSADRPLTESECNLLKKIQETGNKEVILIINKMDILESLGKEYGNLEKQKLVEFVEDQLYQNQSGRLLIFPTSSRDALNSLTKLKDKDTSSSWQRSQFQNILNYLQTNLTKKSKIKTKLMKPLVLIDSQMEKSNELLKEQLQSLETDLSTLNLALTQLSQWKVDLVNKICSQMKTDLNEQIFIKDKKAGQKFLADHFLSSSSLATLFGVSKMYNSTKFFEAWKDSRELQNNNIDINVEMIVENIFREYSDLLATQITTQEQATTQYLGKRPTLTQQYIIAQPQSTMKYKDLYDSFMNKFKTHLTSSSSGEDKSNDTNDGERRNETFKLVHYDPNEQAQEIHDNIRSIFHRSCIAQISGVSIGVMSFMNYDKIGSSSSLMEFLMSSPYTNETLLCGFTSFSLILSGLIFIPNYEVKKLHQAIEDFVSTREEKTNETIQDLISSQLEKIHDMNFVGSSLSPYKRFVTSEQSRVIKHKQDCEDISAEAFRLKNRIQKLDM